jgi:NET1-associated nuclear protein 1 (U3 small nucleolar RNA-associated protein 17)
LTNFFSAQAASNTYPLYTGLVIEPRNHHVVLNGVPGSIQFYNPYLDSHVLDLEIVPMTRISRADENELVHSLVRHVAFMDDGSWMATVDSRDDKITTPELYLKFWAWDPNSQSYILKTRVDYPHSAAITSLSFRRGTNDDLPMAITTSEDKKFKIWHLTSELGRHHTSDETAWTCRAVGFYRENIPTTANFSDDGSMLAVAFGQVLTIWDPSSNTIQGTLTLPPQQCHIHKVAFLGNTPFIAVTTATHLYVWNLLTCTGKSRIEESIHARE